MENLLMFENILQLNTAIGCIAFIMSGAAAWWTFHDPLFKHPICRAPFLSGFIGFVAMWHLVFNEELNGIQFILVLSSIIFMVVTGLNHQSAATKVMVNSPSSVSRYHFYMTEAILIGYLLTKAVLIYALFTNAF
ncbi:hypothetical protein [Vibrio phage BONAISHI]|nr:hypothetical protein [Vibrio phage BONAISHI]